MPPRLPLPRLTLFTGGKECSLCEVAKQELAILRRTTPFELDTFNIRDPPSSADEKEAKKWPRATLPRSSYSKASYRPSRPQSLDRGMASEPANRRPDTPFEPYKSILRFSSLPTRSHSVNNGNVEQVPDGEKPVKRKIPPWRRAVGRYFFDLSSRGAPLSDALGTGQWDEHAAILESTFAGFSDGPVGLDVPVIDTDEVTWEVEEEGGNDGVDIIYDKLDNSTSGGLEETRISSSSIICWNCRLSGHRISSCPEPRNPFLISASRSLHLSQSDHPPPNALAFLDTYRSTPSSRIRRLSLSERFKPGEISTDLADALFYPDEDEEDELDVRALALRRAERKIMKRRKKWPWLERIAFWGYPPGWTAVKDPMQEVRRRIEMEDEEEGEEEGSEDGLVVYGGFGSSSSSSSPQGPKTEGEVGSPQIGTGEGGSSCHSPDHQSPSFHSTQPAQPIGLFSLPSPPPKHHWPTAPLASRNPPPPSPPSDDCPPPPPPPPLESWSPPPPPPSSLPPPPPSPTNPPPLPPGPQSNNNDYPPPPSSLPPPPPQPPPTDPPSLPPGPRPNNNDYPPPSSARRLTQNVFPPPVSLPLKATWEPPRRWATYDTDLFLSSHLQPYSSARPLPLGM
ncbi:hypothetical protein M231_02583 [Tremella mesenterica]|uniref:CCHC-type domain-containing protein n=1 Tax=Tremella mesenterica TaxID=5217 RepID=A0A4Q1BQC4_TREME|nr:hypothetical protein M231_02583 [Tremella mesenterica]